MKKSLCLLLVSVLLMSVFCFPAGATGSSSTGGGIASSTPTCGILSSYAVKVESFVQSVIVRMFMPNGEEAQYSLAEKCLIDEKRVYTDEEDPETYLSENVMVVFMVNEDGEIHTINHIKEKSSYTDISYDKETNTFLYGEEARTLPIFYYTDEEFCVPILSEELLYSVDVYAGTAVVVTSFVSKTKDYVIREVEPTILMAPDFSEQELSVCVATDVSAKYLLMEVEDKNGNVIAQTHAEGGYECGALVTLPNETARYTVYVSIADENNNLLTDRVGITVETEEMPILSGYFSAYETTDVYGQLTEIKISILHQDGAKSIYSMAEKGNVNGDYYFSLWNVPMLTENTFATFSLNAEGEINALNFADIFTFTTYEEGGTEYIFLVEGGNIEDGDTLVFAIYKNNALSGISFRTYQGETEEFTAPLDTDRAAIMTWGSTESMLPITEKEEIEL